MGEDNNRWKEFNLIVDNLNLDIKEKSLLLIIFRYVNYKKGYADPSRALIKKLTGISDNRTLDKIFDSLIEKGFLIRDSGKGKRSKYFIKVGGEITPSVKNVPSGEITPTVGGKITPIVGGEITPQKENKRKVKENIYSAFDSYTENEELKTALKDFSEMRKTIKKPFTTKRAITMLLNKLNNLASTDEEKKLILEQSIFNNWQGIFPQKNENQAKPSQSTTTKQYPEFEFD